MCSKCQQFNLSQQEVYEAHGPGYTHIPVTHIPSEHKIPVRVVTPLESIYALTSKLQDVIVDQNDLLQRTFYLCDELLRKQEKWLDKMGLGL
jgi:hypothetical protein